MAPSASAARSFSSGVRSGLGLSPQVPDRPLHDEPLLRPVRALPGADLVPGDPERPLGGRPPLGIVFSDVGHDARPRLLRDVELPLPIEAPAAREIEDEWERFPEGLLGIEREGWTGVGDRGDGLGDRGREGGIRGPHAALYAPGGRVQSGK